MKKQDFRYNPIRSEGQSDSIDSRVIEIVKDEWKDKRKKSFQRDLIAAYKKKFGLNSLDGLQFSRDYNVIITDATIENPFLINGEIAGIVRRITENTISSDEKARAIYNWIVHNIDYGKPQQRKGYISSDEVVKNRLGICAEMAFLYTAMARSVGLNSNFVSVDVDCYGKRVNHACSNIGIERGLILVDPAYQAYDVKHRSFKIWSDNELMRHFIVAGV